MKVLVAVLLLGSSLLSQTFDILIRNGKVVDGAGNPWTYADVGIAGDRIAFIGTADASIQAKRVIDAKGLIVAPGFIDMLGQSETNLLIDKQAFSKITQGVTTEVTGEGGSIAPLDKRLIEEAKPYTEHFKLKLDWQTLDQYFDRLEKQGSAVNLATFVGATQIRSFVLGDGDRPPTAAELKTMQEMVGDAMDDGALGLSTSLIYPPAFYAKTEELVALAKVASERGGIYATHMRNEGNREMEALDETFRIGREANIPVEIWHLKVAGKQNWGKMKEVAARIERARQDGVDVTADLYPYIAGATSLGSSIPPKYHDGGTEKLLERLRDSQQRLAMRRDMENALTTEFENLYAGAGGAPGVLILTVLQPQLKEYQGKRISEVAQIQGKDPYDTLFDLVLESKNTIGAAYFMMNEEDMKYALQQPWTSIDTDHGAVNVTGPLSEGRAHPRGYGTFPRVLGKYVREEKVLRLEDAIRKITSLPAQRVKLEQRGMLRSDYFADITIFNPEAIIDVATFEDPNRPSRGIEYVIVNGVVEIDGGRITGQLGGRPLRGPGYRNKGVAADGLRPKGKLQGVVTTEDGWPLPRTKVELLDSGGNTVASAESKRDGKYEIIYENPCNRCKVTASRMGFKTAQKNAAFNGANALWFSFTLIPEKRK